MIAGGGGGGVGGEGDYDHGSGGCFFYPADFRLLQRTVLVV